MELQCKYGDLLTILRIFEPPEIAHRPILYFGGSLTPTKSKDEMYVLFCVINIIHLYQLLTCVSNKIAQCLLGVKIHEQVEEAIAEFYFSFLSR